MFDIAEFDTNTKPPILLTHIPLHRPLIPQLTCGPLREHPNTPITPGTGYGYQNTLSPAASHFLLQHLRPKAIFSGDDHDYCEHVHALEALGDAEEVEDAHYDGRNKEMWEGKEHVHTSDASVVFTREVTLKSVSLAMGVRRPGFQLLSLASLLPATSSARHVQAHTHTHTHTVDIRGHAPLVADALCLLPDQIGIYLWGYVPLVLASIALVIFGEANGWEMGTGGRSRSWSFNLQFVSRAGAFAKSKLGDAEAHAGAATKETGISPTRTRGRTLHRYNDSDALPAYPAAADAKSASSSPTNAVAAEIYRTHIRRISAYSHFLTSPISSPNGSDLRSRSPSSPSPLASRSGSELDEKNNPELPLYSSQELLPRSRSRQRHPTQVDGPLELVWRAGRVLRIIGAVAWPPVLLWLALAVGVMWLPVP